MIELLVAVLLQLKETPPKTEPASAAEIEEVCKEVLCRDPVPVRLKLPDGKTFEMAAPPAPMPIVSGGLITVLAGERVLVEADVKDGRLTNLVAVRELTHPERTLILDLKQEPSIGDGTEMTLKIQSGFPGIFKYRLGMMRPADQYPRATSSCALRQNKPVYEHWPYPIFQIVAASFRSVDTGSKDADTCD
jgi:hypothetical protein